MRRLHVHFMPELIAADALAGSYCVVVDVLRATTTIVQALAVGARTVMPCLTIADARRCAEAQGQRGYLLCGERGGLPIPGFDLGNSPAEYTASSVHGTTVVLTTTNGTKALLHCQAAAQVVIGAFVNLSAVCDYLQAAEEKSGVNAATDINIVCAGTDGHITREDVLFAGAVAAKLWEAGGWELGDSAQIARDAWLTIAQGEAAEIQTRLVTALAESRGGRNLIEIGMAEDLVLAAEIDRHHVVPCFDAQNGRILLHLGQF